MEIGEIVSFAFFSFILFVFVLIIITPFIPIEHPLATNEITGDEIGVSIGFTIMTIGWIWAYKEKMI